MTTYASLLVETENGPPLRYRLDAEQVSIGRGPDNDIVLLDIKVSRHHAVLHCGADGIRVVDAGSANGFKHNSQRVREARLQHEDLLVFGSTRVHFFIAGEDFQAEETALTELGAPLDHTLSDHSLDKIVVARPTGTHAVALDKPRMIIGRSAQADIVIDDVNISREHAILKQVPGGWRLIDPGSRNGCYVGEQRVTDILLRSDRSVLMGDARIVFQPAFAQGKLLQSSSPAFSDEEGATQAAGSPPSIERPSIERLSEGAGSFAPQAVPLRAPVRGVGRRRLPVIVIPGFMGSTLHDGERLLWPDVKRFTRKPEFLKLPETLDLVARDVVRQVVVVPGLFKLDAYNRLLEFLSESLGYQAKLDLFSFAYDWRRDLRHAARQLGELISTLEVQGRVDDKFIVLAHSAGGLVARYYVERMGGRHHVERLILMGSPNRGTLKTLAAMLTGIGLLPMGTRKEKLREVMGSFPGAYQLLPTEPQVFVGDEPIDLFADRDWLPDSAHFLLDDARAFLSELGTRSRVPVVSIFGYGHKTITRIHVKRDRDGRFVSPHFDESDQGDGTVSQSSAVLEGSEIHPVRQQHGALYTDPDVKMRLRLELLGQR